jgi:hypothetical protein
MAIITIGTKGPGQYGYKAFVGNGKEYEVWAQDMYRAKQAVIAEAKVPVSKWGGVALILCERPDGSVVTHSGAEF